MLGNVKCKKRFNDYLHNVINRKIMDKEVLKLIIEALKNISWDAMCAGGSMSNNFIKAEECIKKLEEIVNE